MKVNLVGRLVAHVPSFLGTPESVPRSHSFAIPATNSYHLRDTTFIALTSDHLYTGIG